MEICVLLVTFNRCAELEKTLKYYEAQSYKPKAILVVDNNSTDGTGEMLEKWSGKEGEIRHLVLTLNENLGGSGGYYYGMERALELGYEWIFISDDDAIPRLDALERLDSFVDRNRELVCNCAVICGAVEDEGGLVTGHRARINKRSLTGIIDRPAPESEYRREYFDIDFFSYIGACVRASALKSAGLARKEFFIYSDDFEHSLRLRREGRIICVPSVILSHKDNNLYTREASWRDYYATRNLLIMYRECFGGFAAFRRGFLRRLSALRSFNGEKIKVISEGIKDARTEKTGIHPIYRPGWSPNKK